MSTSLQVAAARHAAEQSTGPKTPAGKKMVSYNRLSHGLTSKRVVLPGEDQEAFDGLLSDFMTDYAPEDVAERTLVQQMAESYWRLMRARGVEMATFEIESRREKAR